MICFLDPLKDGQHKWFVNSILIFLCILQHVFVGDEWGFEQVWTMGKDGVGGGRGGEFWMGLGWEG